TQIGFNSQRCIHESQGSLPSDCHPISKWGAGGSAGVQGPSAGSHRLPTATRNPFQLALFDPAIVDRGSTIETRPYHHRTANEMDLGGGTKYRNDILLDGTPLIAGNKLGYTPPMDAVTEYTLVQNSVDAEFGHSAGGIGVITMKSGTNQFHGSAYYYGRNPGLNALTDRALRRHTETPNWTTGASLGMPIIKNK